MKKSTKLLAGATLITSLGLLSGCEKGVYTVYGPPPETNTPVITEAVETEFTEVVYGPPPWTDPPAITETVETELPMLVYGPPPTEEATETPMLEPALTTDPATELPVDLYGPPEFFESGEDRP